MRAPSLRPMLPWVTASLLAIGVLVALPGAAQAAVTNDGTTQATAAASCWEAKQVAPDAEDGTYWILTPQLKAPTKIHCDMTTDGGGWAMIGRGRDGWSLSYNGSGTPSQVADTVTGPDAFRPRQLDSVVVDGLMGGRRIDSMSDGVRIRRAANQAGTSWQEVRWTYRANTRDRWNWSFGAGFPLANVNIGGSTLTNQTTHEFGADSAYRRLWTHEHSRNGYVRGFNFGQGGVGTASATSYIYSKAAGGAYGTPFSQVFIRPKLRTSDLTFSSIPSTGTEAETIRPAPRNGSLASTWGVTGLGAAGAAETSAEVQAFAQIGNVMYVGGNFTTVQKGSDAAGADKVAHAYLAAFDATTGDYIRTFKPVLNNQVKALQALPNGKLAVGGEFSTVNGTARTGIAVLDPSTAALDPTWTTTFQNRTSGGKVSVRGFDTDGTYLYATGSFTHLVRPGTGDRYAKGGARIALSTGIADSSWNPDFNGTGTALDVSDDKTRVYFSGYFTTARGGVKADRAAAFSTASGAPRIEPLWQPTFSTSGSARYQQAIQQAGDKVWLGGSQHSMFSYDTETFALENKHITKQGGDMQVITKADGLVYGGCHCENWNYSDTAAFDTTSPGSTNITWSQADKIYYVGAWDEKSGDFVQEWTPEMRARGGSGAWALKVATDGTLWAGGTMTSSVKENGRNGWVGAFVRYAPRPSTAPAKPGNPQVTLDGTNATVTWSGSGSGTTYEVLRNDRVVATSSTTSATVPGASGSDRYFVRAVDGWGNRSASTSSVSPVAAPTATTLVPSGSTWSYLFDNTTSVQATWKTSATDTSAWPTGAATLGWGTGPIVTDIDVPAGQTRSLTSYYRRSFTVSDPGAFDTVKVTTRADDGVAVYVNGTEVGRSNLPAGTLTPTTYATSAPNTATAIANEVTFDVPVSLLEAGANSIAVEVHSNYRSTPSSSMDLRLVATS